jgi:hypothetical protein
MVRHHARNVVRALLFALVLSGATSTVVTPQNAARLPDRLSDAEFWALVDSISEPGGYFQIQDNFTSNEREIGQLFTMIRDRGIRGNVYMGVGPEQNLTYMAAIRPKMAFIVDIRRQAVMQHLMFKAIFEMANDRADFISLLFSKPRPAGIDTSTAIQKIWESYWNVQSDSTMWKTNYTKIIDRLTKTHGFRLTPEEAEQLKWVFDAFFMHGPTITTRSGSGGGGGGGGGGGVNTVTFADLTGYSNDDSGSPRSFLSSEENFAYVKDLHMKNLIVPVSGDFAGPKAIRAIGSWLKDRGGVVSAFYVSNVEQYLFREGKAPAFYENVSTLPISEESIFIRPYSLRRLGFSMTPLCSIGAYLETFRAGQATSVTVGCPR